MEAAAPIVRSGRRGNPLTDRRGAPARPAGIAIPTRSPVMVSGDTSQKTVMVSGDTSRRGAAVSGDTSFGGQGRVSIQDVSHAMRPGQDKVSIQDRSYTQLARPDSWYAQQYALARTGFKPAGATGDPPKAFPIVPVALGVAAAALLYYTVRMPSGTSKKRK
jgi:hypothetical protein